jgi:CHAD domain-containing protein
MSFAFRPSHAIDNEVKRIAERQLTRALEQLRDLGDSRSDEAVHEARRHLKKVRALLRLVQPALGDVYHGANKRIGTAGRLLAPVADGRAVVDTIARLKKKYPSRLAPRTLASIESVLAQRVVHIDHKARLDRVLPRVASILRSELRQIEMWDLNATGFRAIAPGLEKTVRRARKALARAAAHPTADNHHAWRRRVKDLWFAVRLVEPRCGNGLARIQRQLEALDGYLGEYHNVVLVEQVLMTEALVSRQQAARCLRPLRRYQQVLRHRALAIGATVLKEKPRRFVRRVRQMWKAAGVRQRAAALKATWPKAA